MTEYLTHFVIRLSVHLRMSSLTFPSFRNTLILPLVLRQEAHFKWPYLEGSLEKVTLDLIPMNLFMGIIKIGNINDLMPKSLGNSLSLE